MVVDDCSLYLCIYLATHFGIIFAYYIRFVTRQGIDKFNPFPAIGLSYAEYVALDHIAWKRTLFRSYSVRILHFTRPTGKGFIYI